MRYKLLGKSGLRVSELCLGTMTFGEDWGWGASKEESQRIFDAYSEAGGNFIDTSINYTNGTSEKFLGEFTKTDRDHFVIATKYTLSTRPDDPNFSGNARKNMMRAVEDSLRQLQTDYLDLYYLHMWDYTTPVEEVMRAFDDLVRQGKILYCGISDSPSWVVAHANTLAELMGWSRLVALQVPYSLASRDVERELLPAARYFDMAILPWGMLGGGVLTGKYREADAAKRYDSASEKALTAGDKVVAVAKRLGRTPSQVAINWVRQQPGVMLPILGVRRLEQLQDNLGCLDFELSAEDMAELNAVSDFKVGFPRDFWQNEEVRTLIYGNTFAKLDNHHMR